MVPSLFDQGCVVNQIRTWSVQPARHLVATTLARHWSMLWTLFVILIVLWLVGIIASETLGGFLHILLLLAALALVTELALRYRRMHER